MAQCFNCGADNRDEAKFCSQCGKILSKTDHEKETVNDQLSTSEKSENETVNEREIETTPTVTYEGEAISEQKIETIPPITLKADTFEEKVESPTNGVELQQLITDSQEPPPPLPDGALLAQRCYEIVGFIGTRDEMNEYIAVETKPYKLCIHCQMLNSLESNFCEQCGGDLANAEMTSFSVKVREAKSEEVLNRERTIYEKKLSHPHIATPIAFFLDKPYDERVYAVLPDLKGTPLSQAEAKDVSTALTWAYILADALTQLEVNGFRLVSTLKTSVIFDGKGKPFLLTDAIGLERCSWEAIRQEFSDIARNWLIALQANELADRTVNTIRQTDTWKETADKLHQLLLEWQTPPALQFTVFQVTDVGILRKHNEDSYLTMQFERSHLSQIETLSVLAVADGMGGHAAGEVASKLCLKVLAQSLLHAIQSWLNFERPDWQKAIREASVEANRQVFAEAQAMHNNMGTTLTVAVLDNNQAVFSNIGDSRGYILGDGKLRQVTKDHSYVQQLVDLGMLTPEQAKYHPQGNIITKAVGLEPFVDVDIFEEPLRSGDIILLASDGLVDMVDDSEIERILLSEPDLKRALEILVQRANEAGGEDNITVVLAKAN